MARPRSSTRPFTKNIYFPDKKVGEEVVRHFEDHAKRLGYGNSSRLMATVLIRIMEEGSLNKIEYPTMLNNPEQIFEAA